MTNCPACTAAERNPRADEFANGCLSCQARAMAVTRADLLEDYRHAAERLFGDKVKEGHALVKRWLGLVKQRRAG